MGQIKNIKLHIVTDIKAEADKNTCRLVTTACVMLNVPGLAELFAQPLPKISFPIETERLVHPYLERFSFSLKKDVELRNIHQDNSSTEKQVHSEKHAKKKEKNTHSNK